MNLATTATSGRWQDTTGLVWTCIRVEGDACVLRRVQTVIRGYEVRDVNVDIVEKLTRLAKWYRRVE